MNRNNFCLNCKLFLPDGGDLCKSCEEKGIEVEECEDCGRSILVNAPKEDYNGDNAVYRHGIMLCEECYDKAEDEEEEEEYEYECEYDDEDYEYEYDDEEE